MAKITTKRRMTAGQQAVATAAGAKPEDIQTLTADSDYIEIVEKKKSKGDGIWGYEARLIGVYPPEVADIMGQSTYIKETSDALATDAMKAAKAAREKWPSGKLDEGKAMKMFFEAFVERFNTFIGSTKQTYQGEIAILTELTGMYVGSTKKVEPAAEPETVENDELGFGE